MQVRILVLVLACWAPLAAVAESTVWRVTRGNDVAYLAGSIHVLRTTDYPLPGEFEAAYKDAGQLVLEIDPAAAQGIEAQQLIFARGMYPGSETIRDHLSPALYQRLDAYCRAHQMPLAAVERFKPWLLTMTLAMSDMQRQGFDPQAGIDVHFAQRAARQGKPIAGLETIEEQVNALAAFDGSPDPVVANFLEEAENSAQMMGEMLDAWRQGDVARLDALVSRELRTKYPTLYRALLTERNQRWLAPLERWMTSGKRVLVIVGSAHLVGDDGLVAMLRGRGFRVEKLALPAP